MRRWPRRSARPSRRETVAWGRELLGGNGIVADYNVARFFADAEALYSYEGTYQMQNLIVGKAITGLRRLRVRRAAGSRSPRQLAPFRQEIRHGFAQQRSRLRQQLHHRFANGGTDARECPVREEGRDRLCDGQSAQGAQRPEYADLGGPANGLRGCARRCRGARRHPDRRRRQGVHRRRRHQRARACHGGRGRAVQPLRAGGARSHRESRQAGDRGRQRLCARRRLRDGDGLHHPDRRGDARSSASRR